MHPIEKFAKWRGGLSIEGQAGIGVASGVLAGGFKGAGGSVMSSDGSVGGGFKEGAAYGGVGTAIIAASKYAKKKGMASAEHTKYGLGIGFGIATAALVSTGSTSGSYAPYVAGIGAIAGAVASHKFGSFTKAIGKYG
jgi:hypothetical protein